jgi:Secretory lipase
MENDRSGLFAALGSLLIGSCPAVVSLVAPAAGHAMPPAAPRSVYLRPAPLPERSAGTLMANSSAPTSPSSRRTTTASGHPGTPTPGVGIAEGRAVLDSVHALAQLPNSGKTGPVVIAGESQGGGAALWAAQLAASCAPRLNVRGVAAFAPAAQLPTIVRSLRRPPYWASLGRCCGTRTGCEPRTEVELNSHAPRVKSHVAGRRTAAERHRPRSRRSGACVDQRSFQRPPRDE